MLIIIMQYCHICSEHTLILDLALILVMTFTCFVKILNFCLHYNKAIPTALHVSHFKLDW